MNVSEANIKTLLNYFNSNHFEKGLEETRNLLHKYPYCGKLWEFCGRFYHQLGLFRLSQSALEVATTIIPLSNEAQIALADCYIDSGKSSIAVTIYQHLIEQRKLSDREIVNITKCLESLDEFQTAKSGLQQIDGYRPGIASHHFQLAQYMAKANYPLAMIESELKESVRLDPECIDFRIGLAGFLHCTHRCKEAYQQVHGIKTEYIDKMSCECCLKKLISIYTVANDFSKLNVSKTRLNQLSSF